ncbi:ribbon-helix-helix protein, CopG family [Halorussus gelatinilyticus]|uniref:Ribbon-helix-helix protein, CopG family n=1 Tax=Halorussus gelatinilyticus TaxID=2937524 RepID=A0A8U0IDT8_9EURY|nr:zinc ribbon domain-containing protein [Halorussus gelatinilyticus]UPV98885.1 ribbon-helix-helix protein, CopG family [Halorussus gelatinilyticus]
MSKITFRADEELVERIEARDASKSEIMREALREYLDAGDRRADSGPERAPRDGRTPSAARESREERPRRRDDGRGDVTHRESGRADSLDALLAERVDELVAERLAAWEARDRTAERAQDVNVNVTLERDARADAGRGANASDGSSDRDVTASQGSDGRAADRPDDRATADPADRENDCGQCGETLSDDHVYCPNCGEKASRRVFCECGDEVRSDWGFCPSCGRRTPAADVLDRS